MSICSVQGEGQRATMAFDAALLYALSSLKQGDIVLKKEQREAIKLLYQCKDVFQWLPTGFGKSICSLSI